MIRCSTPNCLCDCFVPGKPLMRVCGSCNHGFIAHGKIFLLYYSLSLSLSACSSTICNETTGCPGDRPHFASFRDPICLHQFLIICHCLPLFFYLSFIYCLALSVGVAIDMSAWRNEWNCSIGQHRCGTSSLCISLQWETNRDINEVRLC